VALDNCYPGGVYGAYSDLFEALWVLIVRIKLLTLLGVLVVMFSLR